MGALKKASDTALAQLRTTMDHHTMASGNRMQEKVIIICSCAISQCILFSVFRGPHFRRILLSIYTSGKGVFNQTDGTHFEGIFDDDKYWSGVLTLPSGEIKTYVQGVPEKAKSKSRSK